MKQLVIAHILLVLFMHPIIVNAQNKPFLSDDYNVPDKLENEYFTIRMLTVNDVVKDYDAVMSSYEHLHRMFPSSNWPSKDLTLEQDLIDLGWHQKEFQRRSSFAYTVVKSDESKVLGCLYIYPSDKEDFDSEIYMWVRESEFALGLDSILFNTVKEWINKDWPFDKVAYPGRTIDWKDWD